MTNTDVQAPHNLSSVHQLQSSNIDDLLLHAVKLGAGIDTIERLVVLRREMEQDKSKKEFNIAMSNFQSDCPVIEKKTAVKNKNGVQMYRYASIDSIVSQVKSLLQKHGFRYTTTMEFNGTTVKATCKVFHISGWHETSFFEVPLGAKTDIMSSSQVVAAASTFAKRYAFLNAFGIMTGDDDMDAQPQQEKQVQPQKLPIPKKKKNVIYSIENENNIKASKQQIDYLVKMWTQYMTKCGEIQTSIVQETLHTFIQWSLKKYTNKLPENYTKLTKLQTSYLIEKIKELPIKKIEKKEVIKAEVLPSENDITDMKLAIEECTTLNDLQSLWNVVLEMKRKEHLKGNYALLHQSYIKTKVSLESK